MLKTNHSPRYRLETSCPTNTGFVGADLENVKRSSSGSGSSQQKVIDASDIDEAEDRGGAGHLRKDRTVSQRHWWLLAIGHTIEAAHEKQTRLART